VVVALDPGLAFGTGHHATTALCLEWLDGLDLAGKTVLDFGCGSGILAIAALKLGAARAIAVDHDPQALTATHDNAQANGVLDRLEIFAPESFTDPSVDVVLANILAGPLIALAPRLSAMLVPGGDLVLSGVLTEQVESVSAAYTDRIKLDVPRLRDDWALITGRR
jgi:ribosomal protein L11 methyltransferase